MDNVICKECGIEYIEDEELHRHLRAHKLRVADYYIKHYPRFDLYTKEPIPFKTKEQYFETDFLNRVNLKNWLKTKRIEEARTYCLDVLKYRIKKKSLYFAPCQVETRSVLMPPVSYYRQIFPEYNELCLSLGLNMRFRHYPGENQYNSIRDKVNNITIDTREQKPINLEMPFSVDCLNFGDYSIDNPEINDNVYVERKSLADFIGTMSSGYERFTNEIERAAVQESYIVVVVEDSLSNALAFNLLPHIFSKIRPEVIFHNVREILQKYDNIQFLFVKGRGEVAQVMKRILFENGLARSVDLQLAYDTNLL